MYTHTSLQTDPWIQVDLQRKTLIMSVKIYNRLDSDAIKYSTNLHNGFIFVSDPEDSPKNSRELCASFYKIETPIQIQNFYCRLGVLGRFVRLLLKSYTKLHICEIQVFGYYLVSKTKPELKWTHFLIFSRECSSSL